MEKSIFLLLLQVCECLQCMQKRDCAASGTKSHTFSVACALSSQVRRRRLDTLERENRTSVKSLKWDIQDILLATECREQRARFTHHVQWVSAPTAPPVTAHPAPKGTKPPTPDKTT